MPGFERQITTACLVDPTIVSVGGEMVGVAEQKERSMRTIFLAVLAVFGLGLAIPTTAVAVRGVRHLPPHA